MDRQHHHDSFRSGFALSGTDALFKNAPCWQEEEQTPRCVISDGYAKVINWAVRNRKTVIFGAFGIFVAVLLLIGPHIKNEYFPHADQGRLSESIELNAGTSQEVTGEFARKLYDRICSEVPEIQICSYTFGQADSDNSFASMQTNGSNIISMSINLGSMENRERSASEIADIIRADLRDYPEIHKGTVTEGSGGMGGAATVDVEIYGYDFQTTDMIANELREKMLANPAFAQVTLSRDQYTPEYQVDFDINNLICNTLKAEGYQCERAFDGKEGADKIEQNRYDLLLLDIMLPEINGYELLDYVRRIGDTPVIIISAMGQVDERIRGLRMGADDYICKPFQIGELLARVETVLRRTQRMAERLEIEDVAIDPKSRTVTKAGEQVELTVKEFDLLYELMKNKNVALSRRRLYELVWQEEYTGETRTLDSHVQRLRKKLDWNEKIVTVFRIGYRLEVRG